MCVYDDDKLTFTLASYSTNPCSHIERNWDH